MTTKRYPQEIPLSNAVATAVGEKNRIIENEKMVMIAKATTIGLTLVWSPWNKQMINIIIVLNFQFKHTFDTPVMQSHEMFKNPRAIKKKKKTPTVITTRKMKHFETLLLFKVMIWPYNISMDHLCRNSYKNCWHFCSTPNS